MDTNIALYIPAFGAVRTKHKAPTLEECQAFVGGYIEIVYARPELKTSVLTFTGERVQVVVNEDGLSMHLPLNLRASGIVGQRLVGNVLLLLGQCQLV